MSASVAVRESAVIEGKPSGASRFPYSSADTQGFAAGREHLNSGTRLQHLLDQNGCRIDDMLATIEDDQHLLIAEELRSRPERDPPKGAWNAQQGSKRRRQQQRIGKPRKIDEQRLVSKGRAEEAIRDHRCKHRLAHASGADNRYQSAACASPTGQQKATASIPPDPSDVIRNGKTVALLTAGDVATAGAPSRLDGGHTAISAPGDGSDISCARPDFHRGRLRRALDMEP